MDYVVRFGVNIMKKIIKKRLVYSCPWTKEIWYGAEEYDYFLPDNAILGAIHEVGKTVWRPTNPDYMELWLLRPYPVDPKVRLPLYRIEVEEFYTYKPTIFDKFLSFLR